jgi:hypothetical protein
MIQRLPGNTCEWQRHQRRVHALTQHVVYKAVLKDDSCCFAQLCVKCLCMPVNTYIIVKVLQLVLLSCPLRAVPSCCTLRIALLAMHGILHSFLGVRWLQHRNHR